MLTVPYRFAIALCLVAFGTTVPAADFEVSEVAPGMYVHFGAHQEMTSENRGDIANIGFVVGENAVAVIDTGGSLAVGQALRGAIARVTSLPVGFVVLTHVHPDHVFGAAAFAADAPEIVGHHRLGNAMLQRGSFYTTRLPELVGAAAEGSELMAPTLPVASEWSLDLGGRKLLVTAYPTAHTDNDLTVLDQRTGTLWVGDLLFVDRVPSLDGSVVGWLAVMERLSGVNAVRAVPGHGALVTDWPAGLARQRNYLQTLADGVRSQIRARGTIQQAVDQVGADQRDRWLLFDAYHPGNVTRSFAELEWE